MTMKYRIACPACDIYVLEKDDGFHLTISSRVNPLSFGSKVAAYATLGRAVDAAETFHRVYMLSKEYGYQLEQAELKRDGAETLSVLELLELSPSAGALRSMFEKDTVAYPS